MKKIALALLLLCLLAVPVSASLARSLEGLLDRAKFVCIAEVSASDGTSVSLGVRSKLRGDLAANSLTFKLVGLFGKPEKGEQYFVFSQGHDWWGESKDVIKLGQGPLGQSSYCGWIMLRIRKENGVEVVERAFSRKFRKPGEYSFDPKKPRGGIVPLTLDQAKQLVRQAKFGKGPYFRPPLPQDK